MSTPLNVIGSPAASGGGCGSCATSACGSCGSAAPADGPIVAAAPTRLSRRQVARAILAASAGIAGLTAADRSRAADPPAAPQAPAPVPLDPNLNVVQKGKGAVMTVLEEFYKIGPGPSSSHTMGPMRITYDFYQRASRLSEDQLKRATALKVRLFGSLSQTGKGHGTDRAALAGILGKAPATCRLSSWTRLPPTRRKNTR
jgi:L-serine dehydratase